MNRRPLHLLWAVAAAAGIFAAACDFSGSPPGMPARPETGASPSAAPTAETLPAAGCGPRAGIARRVADPDGPYGHQVVVAKSTDGVTLSGAHQVLDHASVPDGVALADGAVLIYYVNGEDGATWVARVAGEAVTPIGPIAINGALRPQGVVDPDATLLADGRIRLTYLGNLGPPDPGGAKPWLICMADSTDGVNFTLVGRAIQFTGTATTDPSITQLKDGTWLMAASQGQATVLARSTDGLRFEQYDRVTFGGVPEIATLADGRVRLYVCSRGISTYLSSDAGKTWTLEATDIAPDLGKKIVCDPSYVPAAGVFVYKTGN